MQMTSGTINQQRAGRAWSWDQAGIVLTSLCLVHCLVLPFLIAILPMLGAHFAPDERIHWALSYLATPVAVLALWPGYRQHGRRSVMLVGFIGLAMIFVGPLVSRLSGELAEQVVTGLGGFELIGAHLMNRRLLGCCKH